MRQRHAVAAHLLGMLFDGGVHPAIAQLVARRLNIVIADDQHFTGQIAQIQRLQHPKRHLIIGAEHSVCRAVFFQQAGHSGKGVFGVPVGADRFDQFDAAGGGNRLQKARLAQFAVAGAADAFNDNNAAFAAQLPAYIVAHQRRALGVVSADKGNGQAVLGLRVLIQGIVDVDDDDALIYSFFERRGQFARIGGRDDDGAIAARGQVIDNAGLMLDVRFHLGAEDFQHEMVITGVILGAPFHFGEKRIGQRLHDQGDLIVIGADGGSLRPRWQPGGPSDQQAEQQYREQAVG